MPDARRRSPRAAQAPDAVLDVVLSSPWAISETGLQRVLAVASRSLVEADALRVALEQRAGEPLDNTRTVTIRDGVATIPVRGVMVQRGGLFSAVSGAASYQTIAQDLREAADNPQVRAILLAIDSPGGEVAGCHELAQQIRAVRGVKPIEAVIGGDGCSAAYWLAASCDRIHAAETSVVGSLGVRMSAIDDARALRAQGYRRIEIVSSQTPQKALDPATDDGRSRVQRMVDDLAAVFLADVATARAVPLEQVAAQYGAGDVFVGVRALDAGLIDAIGTYDAVHAALVARLNAPRPEAVAVPGARAGRVLAPQASRASASHQESRMSTKTRSKARRPATRAERTRALKAQAAKDDQEKYDAEGEEEDEDAPTGRRAEDAPVDEDEEETASEETDDEEQTASEEEEEEETASEDEEEDEDAPATKQGARQAASRAASPIAQARRAAATAERQRILGILKYQGRASAEVIMACIGDPTCTAAMAAQRILDAGPSAGGNRLRLLAGDERHVAAKHLTAQAPTDSGVRGLAARVRAGYDRKRGFRAS